MKLNNVIRNEIKRAILEEWDKQNPKAKRVSVMPTVEDLRRSEKRAERRKAYAFDITLALQSFSTTEGLVANWEHIEAYIPMAALNPESIEIPKKVNAK